MKRSIYKFLILCFLIIPVKGQASRNSDIEALKRQTKGNFDNLARAYLDLKDNYEALKFSSSTKETVARKEAEEYSRCRMENIELSKKVDMAEAILESNSLPSKRKRDT